MKQFVRIGWLCLLLVLAVGCEGSLVPQDASSPIIFSTAEASASMVMTKAADTDDMHLGDVPDVNLLLPTDGSSRMVVYADWMPGVTGNAQNVFNHVIVSYQPSTEETNDNGLAWKYTTKYWKRSGDYHFMAVYPYVDKNSAAYAENDHRLMVTYQMRSEKDLMVARQTREGMGDYYNTDPVDLAFHHACAAVRFLFRKGDEMGSYHYYLNSFQLDHVYSVGALSYDFERESALVESGDWMLFDYIDSRVYKWTASGSADVKEIGTRYADWRTNRKDDVAKWHFVIPQDYADYPVGEHPSVTFSVLVDTTNPDEANNPPVYTTLELPANFSWVPGKVYNYYIQIQPANATIQVVTTDWDSYKVAVDDILF